MLRAGSMEFRLPLLIAGSLVAVIINKATGLVVVSAALPSRARSIPFSSLLHRWEVILTLRKNSSRDWRTICLVPLVCSSRCP
jgi:hypothetical protein